MMDNDAIKDEIKRRTDIAEIISQYVPLQRAGRRLKACCPFHQEKTPSFYVDPQGGFWKCFGCGAGGDVFSFVMQIEHLTFVEAAERLAEKVGLQWHTAPDAAQKSQRRKVVQQANEVAATFFTDNLYRDPAAEHARAYVKKRGFTGETVRLFRLGYALNEWESLLRHLKARGTDEAAAESLGLVKMGDHGRHYDVFRNRLIFPITDVTGKVIAFGGRTLSADDPAKYLNTPETAIFKKGHTVYALAQARQAIAEYGCVVVVEGYTDVISLHQAGIKHVVACLGTAMTEDHLQLLKRYTDQVILTYDADAAGMQAALRNVALFEGSGVNVKVAVLPAGEDPDECVRRVGEEGFRNLLAQAVPVAEYQLRMIFGKYAGQGADGLARAAQEAAAALARVADPVRRSEFVARAADYWGTGNAGRTEMMEGALRLELRRHFAAQRAPVRTPGISPRDRGFIFETVVRQAESEISPGCRLLEEDIIAPALNEREIAEYVFSRVAPEEFSDPELRIIAETILREFAEAEAYSAAVVIEALSGQEGPQQRAIELSLSDRAGGKDQDGRETTETTSWDLLQGNIDRLKKHACGGGLRELFEVDAQAEGDTGEVETVEDFAALESRIQDKLNAGELSPDDPEYITYRNLMLRFRGRGGKEYAEVASRVTARTQGFRDDAGAGGGQGE